MTLFIYVLTLFSLVVYSYSQIDLNLTLSANGAYQTLQNQLIYLGYYNRPVSTYIFSIIILSLFAFYIFSLRKAYKNLLTINKIYLLIGAGALLMIIAYPAFSHDIYNYMFDARIVTKYQSNPYFFTALDFPSDLWTRFMHWTHRLYPYGPIWLLITLPFSWLGFGKFVPTLILFKVMFAVFHLGNTVLIGKILEKFDPKKRNFAVVFYGLNPLIIIESIVSPHNEVAMLFFLWSSIYLGFVKKSLICSYACLFISVGIKFITAAFLPILLVNNFFTQKNNFEKLCKTAILLFLLPLIIVIANREPYPWYLITLLGLIALIPKSSNLIHLAIALSLGGLLRYAPYLYFGEYSETVTFWQNIAFLMPPLTIIIYFILKKITKRWNAIIKQKV